MSESEPATCCGRPMLPAKDTPQALLSTRLIVDRWASDIWIPIWWCTTCGHKLPREVREQKGAKP